MKRFNYLIVALYIVSLVFSVFSPAVKVSANSDLDPEEAYHLKNDILFYKPGDPEPCVDTGATNITSPGGVVPASFSLGEGTPDRPINLLRHLMNDYALTPEQAAGIVGNFMAESGADYLPPDNNQGDIPPVSKPPSSNYSSGNAYGWAQWDAGRKRSFIAYSIQNGYMANESSKATDAANYAYLKYELSTSQTTTIPAVKATSNVVDAVTAFEADFERAGTPRLEKRIQMAEKLMEWFEDSASSGGSSYDNSAGSNSNCRITGNARVVGSLGEATFPLAGGRAAVNNPEMFRNGTANQGAHPYAAFDIMADEGTPVLAFIGGAVTTVTVDRCGGQMISIFNQEHFIVISYLHLSAADTLLEPGDTFDPGDQIGVVGTTREGCVAPHLHIDAVDGRTRVGCSRIDCSSENASKYVDIGPDLYKTWEALPED